MNREFDAVEVQETLDSVFYPGGALHSRGVEPAQGSKMLFILRGDIDARQAALLQFPGKLVGVNGITFAVHFLVGCRDIGRIYHDTVDAEFLEPAVYPEPTESNLVHEMIDTIRVVLFQVLLQSFRRWVHGKSLQA